MFTDSAKVYIRSGNGGNGHVSFRRELYVPNGGPDGGDGGRGGDIIFEVDDGLNTLVDFRHVRKYAAENGEEGGKRRCHGADGKDLIVRVPEGTVVKDLETGKVITDMSGENRREVILKGGKGGLGNMHFATATMQVPKYAQPGQPGQELWVPVVPQILTNRAGDFLLASKKLAEMGYREINLNLGCPSGTVTAKKKGSGFLLYPDDLDRFFDEVFSDASVRNGEFQISVKTRIGKNEVEEWPEIMAVYNRYPISELTVHPRIQKEFYKGVPHLDIFADILKESRNPIVYNGDLFTAEHMKKFREKFPTVENVMIGRGLIRNPALAELIKIEEAGVENAQVCAGTENGNKETSPEQAEKTVPESRNTGDNLMPRIRAFHDEIFEYYRETMSGDRNLLFRMKDLWSYMLEEVPDSEKLAKKIRKSQHVPEYLAAVDEAFAGWERTF